MATDNIFTQRWAKWTLDAITQNYAFTNGIRGTAGSAVAGYPLYIALLKNTPTPYAAGVNADNNALLEEFINYQVTTVGDPNNGSTLNRSQITFGTATTGAGTSQSCANTAPAVSFTINGAGGVVTGIAICTTATKGTGAAGNELNTTHPNGNVIWFGEVAAPITVVANNVLTFNVGQITISLG